MRVSGAQRGFSLLMALLILGALALASASALRSAVGAEQVSTGFRMQALAAQAAELALRHCEALLLTGQWPEVLGAAPLAPGAQAWAERAAWSSAAVRSPPEQVWLPPGEASPPWPPPVCLGEHLALSGGQVQRVTARGFSPDARLSQGSLTAGSEVWLQSVLLIDAGQLRQRVQRRVLQAPWR